MFYLKYNQFVLKCNAKMLDLTIDMIQQNSSEGDKVKQKSNFGICFL